MKEIHLLIDWACFFDVDIITKNLTDRGMELENFVKHPPLEKKIEIMSKFYNVHVDDQRGTTDFNIYIINVNNPSYDFRDTNGGKRVVNTNLFDLKSLFRSICPTHIHATDNTQETKDNLKILNIYDKYYKRKMYKNFDEMFYDLNKQNVEYHLINYSLIKDNFRIDNSNIIQINTNNTETIENILDSGIDDVYHTVIINDSTYKLKIYNFYDKYNVFNDERFQEIFSYIEFNNINIKDICIVSSYPMQYYNLRPAGDIDIIQIGNKNLIKVSDNFEICPSDWYSGVSNEDIITNNKYHIVLENNIKMLRLEYLMNWKNNENMRDKDKHDLNLYNKKIDGFIEKTLCVYNEITNVNIKNVIFTKDNNIMLFLREAILNAKKSIQIMAWDCSDHRIISMLNNLNVPVKIITEYRNFSKIKEYEFNNNILIKLQNNDEMYFHHKSIIIDDNVFTGTFNLHNDSLDGVHDEYILEIDNDIVVKQYNEYFNFLWNRFNTCSINYGNNYVKVDNSLYNQVNRETTNILVNIKELLFNSCNCVVQRVIYYIRQAKKSIICLFNWLTLKQILDVLIERMNEGIYVHVIFDKLPLAHKVENPVVDVSPIEYLHNNNVNVSVAFRELFHYKTILIDNNFVLTGTQNFYYNSCFNHYEEFLCLEGEVIHNIFKEHYDKIISEFDIKKYNISMNKTLSNNFWG
jgi:hypothetical protein